jgi:uncharacterized Zn finger protein (UPF0148 family)
VNQREKFTITAVPAPWSEEERRRRLAAAYSVLLDGARPPAETADGAACTRCGRPVERRKNGVVACAWCGELHRGPA